MSNNNVILIALIAAIFLPAFAAADCTSIRQEDVPFRITAAGRYCLQESIRGGIGQPVISIDTPFDVRIDLGGYDIELIRSGSPLRPAIEASTRGIYRKLIIENGSLSLFNRAIVLDDLVIDAEIRNLRINQARECGICVAALRGSKIEDVSVSIVGSVTGAPSSGFGSHGILVRSDDPFGGSASVAPENLVIQRTRVYLYETAADRTVGIEVRAGTSGLLLEDNFVENRSNSTEARNGILVPSLAVLRNNIVKMGDPRGGVRLSVANDAGGNIEIVD